MKKIFILLVLPLLMGVSCSLPMPPVNNTASSDIVDANNKFAIDLYNQYKDKDDNIFFSPYSISSALAMTYEGARGQTAQEIQSVFYFPADQVSMRNSYDGLYNSLNKSGQAYELKTANALWAEKSHKFLDSYFDTIGDYYHGEATNLDFINQTEQSRQTINSWVENQTNDKIKDLIPGGAITPTTSLVLTNAIYFKGSWVQSFNEEETTDRTFTTSGGIQTKVPTMQFTGDEAEFAYTEDNIAQVLELPYSGDNLSMLILLPKDNDIEKMESGLDVDQLSEWREDLVTQRVDVYMPKFKFETKYFMAGDLKSMGMPTAFGGNADFSGMDGEKDLYISDVIHQAFVEVNEEGTEAAAATAVMMEELGIAVPREPIPVFRADHPFVFLIQQNDTGNILFMGKVNNPLE